MRQEGCLRLEDNRKLLEVFGNGRKTDTLFGNCDEKQ